MISRRAVLAASVALGAVTTVLGRAALAKEERILQITSPRENHQPRVG
ncbi:hypothetical protein [Agrobacterium vitis]|uniref:Uncharacterized protein n=1 Tax=Agrobacterium vitis TaxID=373 RepID=A0AAE2R798_AGRVI|nr:hypothetical protein [Agrobacterium vitis]MBF2712793.1 hypothetical protein [Agrobacterium vitis]